MLLSACEQGDQETVEQLVLTEDLEQKNSQGMTPLAIAAKMGNTEILDVLLDAGANINTTSNTRQTPLILASLNNHEDVIKKLLAKGVNVNLADQRGWTPLIISVYQNNENIVSLLLDHGCDIEKKDTFGKQAIDRAKSTQMIELLKSALSKMRKVARNNCSTSSLRSSTPTAARNSTIPNPLMRRGSLETLGRRSSLEVRNSTPERPKPGVLQKTSSERSLSIDFRRLIREKIDKKTRDKFGDYEGKLYKKWQPQMKNYINEFIEDSGDAINRSLRGMIEGKTKDMMGKLKEYANRAFENVKMSQTASRPRSEMKNTGDYVDDAIDDYVSKSKHKCRNRIKKTLETAAARQIKGSLGRLRSELFEDLQFFLNSMISDLETIPLQPPSSFPDLLNQYLAPSSYKNSSPLGQNTGNSYKGMSATTVKEYNFSNTPPLSLTPQPGAFKNSSPQGNLNLPPRAPAPQSMSLSNSLTKPQVKNIETTKASYAKPPKVINASQSSKALPRVDVTSTLKEFLQFEQMSKTMDS